MKKIAITKQLVQIKTGESERFPISKYSYLNSLISKRFNKKGIYFTLKNLGEEVEVSRIKKPVRIKRKEELLRMEVSETYIEHQDHYQALHVVITRLNKEGLGEWEIVKEGDIVSVKRIA